jgi:alkylation response protein AidB-like acyl-CoA dehydrogenase
LFSASEINVNTDRVYGSPMVTTSPAVEGTDPDMATRVEAARLLTRNAAERKAAGLRCDVEAGMAKLFASETALELATEAMRIHDGVGYTTEFPVERYHRDAPLMVIGEGTNEIQRLVIARGLLSRARSA